MNKRAYIKWQITSLLPIYIIIGIVIGFSFLLSVLSSDLVPTIHSLTEEPYYYVNEYTAYPPLYGIVIPSIVAALALPISIFSYQTNHIKSDFFYQIPLKEKELRRIKLLMNLIILEAIITVVYVIGVILIAVKQPMMNLAGGDYFKDNPYYYNYIIFLPYYFFLVISVALTYFTSAYFASLGTRVIDSILYLIFGQGFLAFIFAGIILASMYMNRSSASSLSDILIAMPSFSWLEPTISTNIFCNLLMNQTDFSTTYTIARVISNIGFLIIGSLSFYGVWTKKDPSGEYAGKARGNSIFSYIFPHAFNLMTGIFISVAVGIWSVYIVGWIFFISWCAQYYFLTVAINGGFHFKKATWFIMGGVTLFVFIQSLVLMVIDIVN